MKRYDLALLIVAILFAACKKDKGNYEYKKVADLTIEGIPAQILVLSNVDRIIASPKITSSVEGEIRPDNPNYTFRYRLGYKGRDAIGGTVDGKRQIWTELTPKNGFELDIPASYLPNAYVCWFTVEDKRTNVVTSHIFDVNVSSATQEGWLVLCNEGAAEKVRMDMISLLPRGMTPIYDIASGLPEIHHATQIGFVPTEEISVHSTEGAYLLNGSTMVSSAKQEFNINTFVTPPAEPMVANMYFSRLNDFSKIKYSFVFSSSGNVYLRSNDEAGPVFGLPINTPVAGKAPVYKVAPFVGVSPVRPANSVVGLFYDKDNKRFLKFTSSASTKLDPLTDPDNKLFSFNNTGKNLIYMESTRISNGLVYAILQDTQGKRTIYGINMGGNGFVQELYHPDVNAPGFEQATHFAFHSKFPLLFYSAGSKVYLYNLGTKAVQEMSGISQGEITCLKFNLYRSPRLNHLNNQTEEFMNQQFQLIIGSYDNTVANGNGGKVSFYDVNGQTNSINKLAEYSGFAKVKDVVYRER